MKSIKEIVGTNIFTILTLIAFMWAGIVAGCKKQPAGATQKMAVLYDTGYNVGFSAVRLTNGNYVAACNDITSGNTARLYCVDANGNRVWTTTVIDSREINSIVAMPDGGFAVAGSAVSKYSAGGEQIWSSIAWQDSMKADPNFYGIAYYPELCTTPDGGLALYHAMWAPGGYFSTVPFLTKMSADGKILSVTRIALAGLDSLTYDVFKMTADNTGIYFSGTQWYTSTVSLFINFDFCSFKTDLNGALLWVNAPNYTPNDFQHELALNNAGSSTSAIDLIKGAGSTLIATVDSNCFGPNITVYDAGHYDTYGEGAVCLKVFDAGTGAVTRTVNMTFPNASMHPYIAATADGGYVVTFAGNVNPNSLIAIGGNNNPLNYYSTSNVTLVKFDASLTQQWARTIPSPYPAMPFAVFQTPDGGYIIFVTIESFGANKGDLAIFKLSAAGNLVGD